MCWTEGRHTTRGARLYRLPIGGDTFVADTPGIRELGLYEIDPQDLGFYFLRICTLYPRLPVTPTAPTTTSRSARCARRWRQGKIHAERYESYLRLLHGEE